MRIGPEDPRYRAVVDKRFNKRFRGAPDYVRLVHSTEEVMSAVEEAVKEGRRLVVTSGGHCLEGFVSDPDVRVVGLRGAGDDAFASGADIAEFSTHRKDAKSAAAYEATTARAFEALLGLEKPLVAAIQGVCIGGGLAIAATADLRIAADEARFALPPARLGLGYHLAGVERMVRLLGPSAAAEMLTTRSAGSPRTSTASRLDDSEMARTMSERRRLRSRPSYHCSACSVVR